jgi:hypothetical protein
MMTDELMPLHSNEQTGVPGPLDAIQRALATGATPETLAAMMALQERYEANEARAAFNSAIAKAQAEFTPVVKNRTAGFETRGGGRTEYQYEDLAAIAQAVNPILAKYGLGYRYSSKVDGMMVSVTCILFHHRGHSEETTLSSGMDTSGSKNPIQSLGSALSYLQRYSLKLALGLSASKDDDGQAAGNGGDKGNAPRTIDAAQFQYLSHLIDDVTALEQELLSQEELVDLGTVELRLLDLIHANDLETITQSQFGAAKAGLLQLQRRRKQALEVQAKGPR